MTESISNIQVKEKSLRQEIVAPAGQRLFAGDPSRSSDVDDPCRQVALY